MLSEKDLAQLNTKLYVPFVVRDIIEGAEQLTCEAKYGLHEVISDFQPDSALLAIALSASKIAQLQSYPAPGLKKMQAECERIVSEYAPLWLEHARNKRIDDSLLFETLINVPEDLELIADLLASNIDFLHQVDRNAAALAEILQIQAAAHAMIAEEYVDAMDEGAETLPDMSQTPQAFANNVIPFPGIVGAVNS